MLTEPVVRASTYILTLAIPTNNGGNRISPLLLSLKANGYLDNTDTEVLIANNCSTDHTAEVILSALSSLSGPHLLASREEYLAVHSRKKAAPVIPFGFISSTIQPNTDCLLDSTIKYSDNPHHSSPHFFARWEFFLRNGPAYLAELPSAGFLVGRPVTASPTTFKELKNKIHTLLTHGSHATIAGIGIMHTGLPRPTNSFIVLSCVFVLLKLVFFDPAFLPRFLCSRDA
jgi:hypothetical protein